MHPSDCCDAKMETYVGELRKCIDRLPENKDLSEAQCLALRINLKERIEQAKEGEFHPQVGPTILVEAFLSHLYHSYLAMFLQCVYSLHHCCLTSQLMFTQCRTWRTLSSDRRRLHAEDTNIIGQHNRFTWLKSYNTAY